MKPVLVLVAALLGGAGAPASAQDVGGLGEVVVTAKAHCLETGRQYRAVPLYFLQFCDHEIAALQPVNGVALV